MDLDTLSKLIEENKRKFEDTVARHAKHINLKDVLKKLEGKAPELNEWGWFIFKIRPYEIMVSDSKLNLFGYDNLVQKEFRGKEVEDFYHKLSKNYAKVEEVPF